MAICERERTSAVVVGCRHVYPIGLPRRKEGGSGPQQEEEPDRQQPEQNKRELFLACPLAFIHFEWMATARTTITLSEEAFKLLKKFKAPGDTYSDVILEHMDRPPARTAGELLKRLEEIEGQPIVNPELMAKDDSAVALAVKRYEERLRRNSAGDRGQFERVCQLCNVEM